MVQKVLFTATVDYHFKAFHLPYLKWFKEQGWDVHVAASGDINLPYVDQKYNLPIERSPVNKQNITAYRKLKHIIDENQYEMIHCHTPMGGVLTRLAARAARKHGTKVIYTAHGFHFCKGAPLANWALYYPIEKGLAHCTDCLITINEEDYRLASSKLKTRKHELVHGVGVNTEKFKPISDEQKSSLRKSLGYQPDDFLFIYAAEFNTNKNQSFLIRAFEKVVKEIPNARILLAGEGEKRKECRELAKRLEVDHRIDFLGFRKDIQQLLTISDVAVGSSLREGLPVNIMEAMACGLPVIAVDNRGHRELIHHSVNGWLITKNDSDGFAEKMKFIAKNIKIKKQLGKEGRRTIVQKYSEHNVLIQKREIYQMYMKKEGVGKWAVH
ncbi:glycosyltransferase family 4 protein [Halobacillus sp. B23F22_1]|uniref:glycosyltransferase family 4 protein n=1 Tax=Halobacillus sp. B23F22_1 TaxID=3459514 RepID=UPI00373EBAAE